jgi:hypothetical protein
MYCRQVDQLLDFLGGTGAALRETAHFGSDHRKSAPLFTGARRFYRSV